MDNSDRATQQEELARGLALEFRRELDNPRMAPIVQVLDGTRFGVCHYCESPIRPGNLFCEIYPEDPHHSCSAEWEHERQRKKAMGL